MNRSSALLLAFVFLSGCQALAPVSPDGTPPVEDSTPAPEKPKVYSSFNEETIYSLLTAELAGQRNRFDIALDNYVTQAINTQDPGISERAFRIAEYLGADQAALDTSLIWARNAPDDLEAQRAAAIQLARAGRYDDSMVYMEKVLLGKGDTHFDFLALSAADTDQDTRNGLMKSFDRLLQKHPKNSQLIFGKALLLQQDDEATPHSSCWSRTRRKTAKSHRFCCVRACCRTSIAARKRFLCWKRASRSIRMTSACA